MSNSRYRNKRFSDDRKRWSDRRYNRNKYLIDDRKSDDRKKHTIDDRKSDDKKKHTIDDRKSDDRKKHTIDDRKSDDRKKHTIDDRKSDDRKKHTIDDRKSDRRDDNEKSFERKKPKAVDEVCEKLYKDDEKLLEEFIKQEEETLRKFDAYGSISYPDFRCFTLQCSNGDKYVITIHDLTLFKQNRVSVCVGSHSVKNTIVVQRMSVHPALKKIVIEFKCYDCERRESECGPFDMYHIVHYGTPVVLCKTCWVDSGRYPSYNRRQEELFYKLISISDIATMQTQSVDRLDTFVVNTNNERMRLTCYIMFTVGVTCKTLFAFRSLPQTPKIQLYKVILLGHVMCKSTFFELLMYVIVSISRLQYIHWVRLIILRSCDNALLHASQTTM